MKQYIDGFNCIFVVIVDTDWWYGYGFRKNELEGRDIVATFGSTLEKCQVNIKEAISDYWVDYKP